MKRMHVLGAALVAVFAFGAFASVASAVEFLLAEWLLEGEPVTSPELVDSEGTLTLTNNNAFGLGINVSVECSGVFDGWVGENGLDWNSEVLNLKAEAISLTALSGLPLEEPECKNIKECPKPLVWPDGIPGETLLVLMVDGTESFFVDLLFSAGWYVECSTIIGQQAELCEASETAVQLANEANGTVDAAFSDTFQVLAGLTLATCNGKTEAGEVNGLGFILPETGVLEVSSEP